MNSDDAYPPDQRDAGRLILNAEVGIRRSGGHSFRVRVFDASPEGCKIEFVERPAIGERIWVKFDGLEGIEATVCWVDGHMGGVQFGRPLHVAVFQGLAGGSKKQS
jgi:PilZ domain